LLVVVQRADVRIGGSRPAHIGHRANTTPSERG
jgi:hypothetical protein